MLTPELEVPPELDGLPELDVLPPVPDEELLPDASGKSPMSTNPPLHPGVVDRTTPTAASAAVESKTEGRITGSLLFGE